MDLFRKQTLDADRAKKVLSNTHDRLGRLRKKTDEEYLKILIDEINKYFSSLETTSIDSNDLPTLKDGPNSIKHNKLVSSIVDDIDIIHGKQRTAEEMLTKAVNYMSSERDGVAKVASRLHSRIVAHKLRSAVNDRNVIVFTDYFNDDGLTDVKASKNFQIDPARSALSLAVVAEEKDNSALVDPNSIRVVVELDKNEVQPDELPAGFNSIYPLCNQLGSEEFTMGFGRILGKENIEFQDINLTKSSDEEGTRKTIIQKQSLKSGYTVGEEETPESTAGEFSHAEFELVWMDFTEIGDADSGDGRTKMLATEAVINSVADAGFEDPSLSIDKSRIVYDADTGTSFHGTNKNDGGETSFDKLTRFSIRFSLREGASLTGKLTRINIRFVKPEKGGILPKINYPESTIITSDGVTSRPFVNPPDSIENKVGEARALMLSRAVERPKHFKVTFDVAGDGSKDWHMLEEYKGAYWRVPSVGTEVAGYASIKSISGGSIDVEQIGTAAGKIFYVYHDLVREDNAGDLREANTEMVRKVLDSQKTEIS